jgi:hypothetical protein
MVPGKAKKLMRGFSFKPKSKKSKEADAVSSSGGGGAVDLNNFALDENNEQSFFISENTEPEMDRRGSGGVSSLLTAQEREKLYASVAAKHEEVALISGTDIWLKVFLKNKCLLIFPVRFFFSPFS